MISRRHFLTTSLALPALSAATLPAFAAEPHIFSADGAAINGYDPVAYFTQKKPVKGSGSHSVSWKGAEWHFASADNKAAFEAAPEDYAPKFGGYCAYAVSRGYTAPTVPEAWSIYEGKLYLNFSLRARDLWSKDIPGNIAKGEANWPNVLSA